MLSVCLSDDEAVVAKDMATETTSSEEEQEFPVPSSFGAPRLSAESPMDGRAMRRSSRGSFTRASLEDLLSIDPEAYQSSVWLGTEDGWWVNAREQCLETNHIDFVSLHPWFCGVHVSKMKNSLQW